jgi:solute carrier family 25 protein 34/35
VMQPADTVSIFIITLDYFFSFYFQALTRMYNQPTIRLPNGRMEGTLYKNPIDCLWKTVKAEGIFGWYKGLSVRHPCRFIFLCHFLSATGSTAHFLRIAPHT